MPEKQEMARNLKKLKDNIVTITDYSQNEFEKFQLRGSHNFFGDFLLYENPLTFAHTHAIISKVRSEGELFVETTAG